MIFKFDKVGNSKDLCIRIEHKSSPDPIEFNVNKLINTRNREKILSNNEPLFYINGYFKYKGEDWCTDIFKTYQKALLDINNTIYDNRRLYILPSNITDQLLDKLDYNDILHYLKNVAGLIPPPDLKEVFDESIEKDGKGTRVQTYLKSDYMELAAILIISQFLLPLLGQYFLTNENKLGKSNRNYTLFNMVKQHPIFQVEAITKLTQWIEVLVENNSKEEFTSTIRVLRSQLPNDEIPILILGSIVIEKLSVYVLGADTSRENMINSVYGYIQSKLRSPYGNEMLKDKTMLSDKDSASGDKESIIESTRITATLNTATPTELMWSIDTIDKIIYQLPQHMQQYVDKEKAYIIYKNLENRLSNNIVKVQIILLGFIFKNIIDSRALFHVNSKCLLNLMAVAFTYLEKIGYLNLALPLVSYYDTTDGDLSVSINMTGNMSRIPKEIKNMLSNLYPYERQVNKTKTENLAEASISNLVAEMFTYKVINTLQPEVLEAVIDPIHIEDIDLNNILNLNMKLIISKFVVSHELLLKDGVLPDISAITNETDSILDSTNRLTI